MEASVVKTFHGTVTKRLTAGIVGLLALLLIGTGSWAAPASVAIIPFNIYSDKDLGFLKNGLFDMLTSRLYQEGKVAVTGREATEKALTAYPGELNESQARNLGAGLKADYVLYGSLTVLGESVSIDLKMLNLADPGPPQTFFAQAETLDKVIPRVNELASQLNETYFGVRPAAAVAAQPAPESSERPSSYAHPEKQLEAELLGETGGEIDIYPGADEEGSFRQVGFKKIHRLKENIVGISTGDVDGEAGAEVVLISSQKVHLFRVVQERLVKVAEFEGDRFQRFFSVDVVDVKKDGRGEIFVSAMDTGNGTIKSVVLEWSGTGVAPCANLVPWYFRAIDHSLEGKVLLGQKRSINELFLPGVYRMQWDGREYVGQDRMALPSELTLFGFAMGSVLESREEVVAALDGSDRIRLFSAGGQLEWKSDESYGGSENILPLPGQGSPSQKESDKHFYLPQRILLADTGETPGSGLLVVKNEGMTGRMFKNYRRYTRGWIEALTWDGLGMTPVWRTRRISGYISDFYSDDLDGNGSKEVLAVVVTNRGMDFLQADSSIIVISLDALKKVPDRS
jgi:TolB-like protein